MREKIKRFIQHGGDFSTLSLELWKWQVDNNPAYGRFCQGIVPQTPEEIPAVPVGFFRDVDLCCFPPFMTQVLFRTSGTTGRRGVHKLQDTELYDLGAVKFVNNFIGPIPEQCISLVSPAVDSSLGHMCRLFSPKIKNYFIPEVGVFKEQAWAHLLSTKAPVFLPGTAFAFESLLSDYQGPPCELPQASIIMVTGGFKGYHTSLNETELYSKLRTTFPHTRIVGEYGMTELCSQLWSKQLGQDFYPPHWLKVITVDPQTGRPTDGIGQLRFIDLANHQSVLAIETQDQGEVNKDGSVTLLGRLPSSPLRGCSLTAEEAQRPRTQLAISKPVCQIKPAKNPRRRTNAVVQAIKQLEKIDPTPLSQGLTTANAKWGLLEACRHLTEKNLNHELNSAEITPENITIVASQGVFTSPLEWIALSAASGAEVEVKPPSQHPQFCQTFVELLQQQNIPIRCVTESEIQSPQVLISFGSDQTIESLQQKYPETHHCGYGHRFSIGVTNGQHAKEFAQDIVAYDTRGCMSPVGLFVIGPAENFATQLGFELANLQQIRPIGQIDPMLGPEFRYRLGLAKTMGSTWKGEGWSVAVQPSNVFIPSSLPRTGFIYSVSSVQEFIDIIQPWQGQISSCAWGMPSPAPAVAPRICEPGHLQKPIFPRLHDGKPMWKTISGFG